MQLWKGHLLRGGVILFLIAALVLGLAVIFQDFVVNLWWFGELHYEQYFWYRLLYRYLVFLSFSVFFFLLFFLNFWIASRYLGVTTPARTETDSRFRTLYRRFRKSTLALYLPLSLVLAVVIALPLYYRWEQALLYLYGPASGLTDPVYGADISYYLFSLPIYLLLFSRLLLAAVVILAGVGLLYWFENRLLAEEKQPLARGARLHLSILTLVAFLIGAWWFVLQRHVLLYNQNHTPLFYGPGFVEMNITLPLIWVCLMLLLGVGLAFIYYMNTGHRKALAITFVFALLFGGALSLRYYHGLPHLAQKLIVEPNALARETPYIQHNITATLDAYGLSQVEVRDYPIKSPPWDMTATGFQQNLRNIPVWDEEDALKVYENLQEIRTYYDFPGADVDRYVVDDSYQQVLLAPREIDAGKLPSDAQTWVNRWLKYTHGYGVVMTPAAQLAEGPMTWLMQGIPPISSHGLNVAEPGVYYGLGRYDPVIAPNESREIDYSLDEGTVLNDYKGQGGVPVSNIFRKLLFALYFRDKNIFFTTQINDDSRLLFRRNIDERIRTLTPFLTLDRDPYIVAAPERLYWIQDAYTTSEWYPYSQPYPNKINYIRNSVKIVVDAYNGSVDYYIADERDPIIKAYARIYPKLFKSFDALPEALQRHVRYPRDIFAIQLDMYAKYHQTDPRTFYNQEDLWVLPQLPQSDGANRTLEPYYLTLNLIDPAKTEFMLMAPLTPKAQDNLRALLIAGCDGQHYGRLFVYNFPKGKLVYGPAQANSMILQDPQVSEQRTLWNQEGSQSIQGRLITLPLDGVVVYVQPMFLQVTTGPQAPQLKRFIVSQGQLVVVADSLEAAFQTLNERVAAEADRQAGAPPPIAPPPEPPQPPAQPPASEPTADPPR